MQAASFSAAERKREGKFSGESQTNAAHILVHFAVSGSKLFGKQTRECNGRRARARFGRPIWMTDARGACFAGSFSERNSGFHFRRNRRPIRDRNRLNEVRLGWVLWYSECRECRHFHGKLHGTDDSESRVIAPPSGSSGAPLGDVQVISGLNGYFQAFRGKSPTQPAFRPASRPVCHGLFCCFAEMAPA